MGASREELPAAVARHQASWGGAAVVGACLVLVCLGYVALRGWEGEWQGIALIIGGSALFITLKERRLVVAAGPGWLSVREMIRTRVVRTDSLVKVTDHPCGTEHVLTLTDSSGGRLGVTWIDLRENPRILSQVQEDVRHSLANGAEVSPRSLEVLGLSPTGE